MRYGFVKVCAATPKIRVADVDYNVSNIILAIKEAVKCGSQIIVFPELCVCGYTCGDLFNQSTLIDGVEAGVARIKEATLDSSVLVFVGAPVYRNGRLYNCAIAISNGEIKGVVPKTILPDYGELCEGRYFSSGFGERGTVQFCGNEVNFGTNLIFAATNDKNVIVGAEICDDLWAPKSPSVCLAQAGANIIVNLSCVSETVGKANFVRSMVEVQSAKIVCGYVYCEAGDGESTTDLVFSGSNVICENGKLLIESQPFNNQLTYAEIDVDLITAERCRTASSFYFAKPSNDYIFVPFMLADGSSQIDRKFNPMPFIPSDDNETFARANTIINIQTKGLEKRLLHTGAKKVIVGVSGGLDSTLALLVTRRVFLNMGLPLSNIIAITMPGFGTTARTKNNSLKLIELMGATCKVIPIADCVNQHFKDIEQPLNLHDVTYENAQARVRTLILMDVANQVGGLVVGTGDLSELALGWATYNGDHMSMYGVNASVPKTLIKYLVKAEATAAGGELEKLLTDILETEISPELLPPDENGKIAQKTESLVGSYELNDFFIYNAVRYGFAPEKIKYMAVSAFNGLYGEEVIEKWLKNFYKRFFSQQFKRSCLPDGVKVGSVDLSPRGDWRMPSDAVSSLWLKWAEQEDKNR